MKNLLILLMPVLSMLGAAAQKRFVVRGSGRAEGTGEILIGATLSVPEQRIGANTNEYKFYSLTLPAGKHTLFVSAIGMQPKEPYVSVTQEIRLNITLTESVTSLEEVRVTTVPPAGASRIRKWVWKGSTNRKLKLCPCFSANGIL